MPTKAEGLTPESSDEDVQVAVSDCISQMADEHPDWDNSRRVAACYSLARTATGKTLLPKGETRNETRVIS